MQVKKHILLLVMLFLGIGLYAQHKPRYTAINLPGFDYRKYHFGFTIGVNKSDWILTRQLTSFLPDSVLNIKNEGIPGFELGIVGVYRPTKNIAFKSVPAISFQDRKLRYSIQEADTTIKDYEKLTEATYVVLPVYIKLRTNRINNFASYLVGGVKFMQDMSSYKDVKSRALKDILIQSKKSQIAADFGMGMDFFLPYFKFGIEFKMAVGLTDVHLREKNVFSRQIETLVPKSYSITFTFEG
jgi:hypothetical protein